MNTTMMTGRFAPTPSGRMHIGNVYALFAAWLSVNSRHADTGSDGDAGDAGVGADAGNGRMLLRIEDVDVSRAVPDADRWIMDDLNWLGLRWQGEPVYQSQRLDIYRQAVDSLRAMTLVYPCFCSRSDLRAISAPQQDDGFVIYPGTCRRLALRRRSDGDASNLAGKRHSLRIAVPDEHSPRAEVGFVDRVFGERRFNLAREVGDVVLRRSDGLYSYHLASVVDDVLMGVDDVVRGRDLLRSTALHIWLREQLAASGFWNDAPPVRYAHLPLIDTSSGIRLAKRKHSLDMGVIRASHIAPEQVIGYCAWLLGIRPGSDGGPVAMSAQEALPLFSWRCLRGDTADRTVDGRLLDVLRAIR